MNATPSNDSSAPWRTAARMEKACSSTTGDISPTRIAALAILDMSAAAEQPMRSLSGLYDITYNGEVYNFLELRGDIEGEGFRFRSDSDTEVILAAFERWEPDCLLRFNGMWSFAIWNRRRRTLFLSRDRFGIKPLYVAIGPRRFAFASEPKAFLHLDGFAPVADIRAVEARLAGNTSERLLLRGIESVPPGYYLEVTPEGTRRRRWWNTLDHLVSVPRDLATQAEEFRELLFDACRLRVPGTGSRKTPVPHTVAALGGPSGHYGGHRSLVANSLDQERHFPVQPDARLTRASEPGELKNKTGSHCDCAGMVRHRAPA